VFFYQVDVCLAQCVAHLARAPKSIALYRAVSLAQQCIRDRPNEAPPMHILNAPTQLMRELGYGAGYKYNPDHGGATGAELGVSYLPACLEGTTFLTFDDRGDEAGDRAMETTGVAASRVRNVAATAANTAAGNEGTASGDGPPAKRRGSADVTAVAAVDA